MKDYLNELIIMRVFVVITLILLTISIPVIAVQVYASTKFWMKSGEVRKTKTPDERLVNTEQAIGSLPFGGKELMQYYEQLTLLNNASAHAALAANQEEIFIYMVTVDTSSDWTEVILSEGPRIISYNYSLKGPTELRYSIRPGYIGLSKRAYDTTPVSVNMTLLALRGESWSFTVRKGDIGFTRISIYKWIDGTFRLEQSFLNEGTNPQHPGTNDRTFFMNLLYDKPAGRAIYEDTAGKFSRLILTFYYPWYGTPNVSGKWFHWEGVTGESIANTAHYPLLGIYDSWDERVINAHILMAKSSGVDCFIVSWWGIGSFEDEAFKRILKAAERQNFSATIYYESYRPWNPLVSEDDVIRELSYVLKSYSQSKAFLRIDGKPVIFIYNVQAHGRSPQFWLNVRRALEREFGEIYMIGDLRNPLYLNVFNGFHTYIELNRSSMSDLYLMMKREMSLGLSGITFNEAIEAIKEGKILDIERKALFYTVVPGYDDRKIRYPGNYLDRAGGKTYRMFWEDALKSGARLIIITSFNELHEGTEIEPTREYGYMFLNITREYCRKLKEVHEEKAPEIKFSFSISRDGKNLSMDLVNEGGPAIAVELSSLPQFVKPFSKYLQNGKVLIPLIGGGEAYRVNFSLENASLMELRISFLLSFYSASGHLYRLEIHELPVSERAHLVKVSVYDSYGVTWRVRWSGEVSGSESGSGSETFILQTASQVNLWAEILSNQPGYTCTISPSFATAKPGDSIYFSVDCAKKEGPTEKPNQSSQPQQPPLPTQQPISYTAQFPTLLILTTALSLVGITISVIALVVLLKRQKRS